MRVARNGDSVFWVTAKLHHTEPCIMQQALPPACATASASPSPWRSQHSATGRPVLNRGIRIAAWLLQNTVVSCISASDASEGAEAFFVWKPHCQPVYPSCILRSQSKQPNHGGSASSSLEYRNSPGLGSGTVTSRSPDSCKTLDLPSDRPYPYLPTDVNLRRNIPTRTSWVAIGKLL